MFSSVLNDETATAMRLLGVEKVEDLGMQHVSFVSVVSWKNNYLLIFGKDIMLIDVNRLTLVLSNKSSTMPQLGWTRFGCISGPKCEPVL